MLQHLFTSITLLTRHNHPIPTSSFITRARHLQTHYSRHSCLSRLSYKSLSFSLPFTLLDGVSESIASLVQTYIVAALVYRSELGGGGACTSTHLIILLTRSLHEIHSNRYSRILSLDESSDVQTVRIVGARVVVGRVMATSCCARAQNTNDGPHAYTSGPLETHTLFRSFFLISRVIIVSRHHHLAYYGIRSRSYSWCVMMHMMLSGRSLS